jgi:arylsulfatase A-like enzyme
MPHLLRCVGLLMCALGVASAAPSRPNLVFILADDLGWSDTTLFGQTKFCETPNLERLADRGMSFRNAYAAHPLCSPTRASILTGLDPGHIGITVPNCHLPAEKLEAALIAKAHPSQKALTPTSATRLSTNYFTLAKALKQAGYVTGHFGKWHLGPEPYSALQQGFDVDVPHYPGPGPAGSYVAPWKFPPQLKFTGQPEEHIEERMATEAIRFIHTNQDRPFYLNYWSFSVHAPFDGRKDLIEKYRRKADPADEQRCPVYGAMVQSLDEAVGRLLDTLDALDLSRRTIVVFFSDNGGNMYNRVEGIPPTSNRPLRGGKATLFEGGTRVPCAVIWPGKVKPGSTSDALLSSTDFYPTILEMLGLDPQPGQHFDGVSQVPTLLGRRAPRQTAYCFFPHYTPATGNIPGAWVRRGDWKLIRFFCDGPSQANRVELYNLRKDMGETKDLASDRPRTVKRLDALLSAFLRDTRAVLPKPNPAYSPDAPPPLPPAPRARPIRSPSSS